MSPFTMCALTYEADDDSLELSPHVRGAQDKIMLVEHSFGDLPDE